MQWIVSEQESGMRLLPFLQSKLGSQYSSRQLKRLLEKNCCTVNKRIERFGSHMIGSGDVIAFTADVLPTAPRFTFSPTQVLYEDKSLLVYNKPSGIASDSEKLHSALSKGTFLALVHRLDRDTTGALIFAKTEDVYEAMLDLFKNRRIAKEYLAIVDGIPKQDEGNIDNFLGEIKRYQGQTIWGKVEKSKGLHAITAWRCEKRGKSAALLHCYPKTGRTHQLRVHLSSIGHPILGDHQYANRFQCAYHPERCLLHAYMLTFPHPTEDRIVHIKAPVPDDFLNAMHELFGEYENFDR